MKILIADDDSVARNLLQVMLEQWNYEVVSAKNGKEAWEILHSENSPSLCILDIQMPFMTGEEICVKIKSELQHKPFYLILITGELKETSDIIEGINLGADDYITKPFVAKELLARVNAGVRILNLEFDLQNKINELEKSLEEIKKLKTEKQ